MPMLTRRSYLALSAAALALPRAGFAADRLTLGDAEIVALSDGHLVLPSEFLLSLAPQDELADLPDDIGLDLSQPLTPPCNITLMRSGDRTVLFDCGAGSTFMPTVGRLQDALDAEGLAPGDITDVVFTHAHPDHLWGVLDDFDEPLFLNAVHRMGRVEHGYWTDPDTVESIGEARASFAAGAARRLSAVDDRVELFEDGAEVLPGVTAMMTPGHTPGHMAFVLSSGNATAMVIGDAAANDHVAVARPAWPSGADQDPQIGAATRVRLLDMLATDGMTAVGFHMGGGGVGRIERADERGYRFVTDL